MAWRFCERRSNCSRFSLSSLLFATQVGAQIVNAKLQIVALAGEFVQLLLLYVVFLQHILQAKIGKPRGMLLIIARLSSLHLYAAQPLFDFFNDVSDAQKIRIHFLEFSFRLFFLGFVFTDAGGFFENGAALGGVGFEHRGDFALLDDAVGVAADAGIEKELTDVF